MQVLKTNFRVEIIKGECSKVLRLEYRDGQVCFVLLPPTPERKILHVWSASCRFVSAKEKVMFKWVYWSTSCSVPWGSAKVQYPCPLATQGHQDSRQNSKSVALCPLTLSVVLPKKYWTFYMSDLINEDSAHAATLQGVFKFLVLCYCRCAGMTLGEVLCYS